MRSIQLSFLLKLNFELWIICIELSNCTNWANDSYHIRWTSILCLSSADSRPKRLSHWSHACVQMFWWTNSLCLFRLCSIVNVLSHWSHVNGLTPENDKIDYYFKCLWVQKLSKTNINKPLCVRIWYLRLAAVIKRFPHWSHACARFPWWTISLWFFK